MTTPTEPRIDFVRRCLRAAMPRNWPAISSVSGVPQKTIVKIAYGETLDPRTSTTQALHDYFVRCPVDVQSGTTEVRPP